MKRPMGPRAARPGGAPPDWVPPQLALAVKEPPSGPGWAHEIKYDGYRLHARIENGKARLLTRTGLDWTGKYPAIAAALAALPVANAYLDGELCAFRADGTTSFAALQAAASRHGSQPLVYILFDLLFRDGQDLMKLPLRERKTRLQELLQGAVPSLRYGEHTAAEGRRFLAAVREHALEGIVSKRLDSPYAPGDRGLWQKVKCLRREEFVILGFTEPEGRRPFLGSLLLGYYGDDGKLHYAGRAGTGISTAELGRLHAKLASRAIAKPAAALPPRTARPGPALDFRRAHWVRPELVCEVTYQTWTADGLLRAVTYEGLREDKAAADVRRPD